MSSRKKKKTSVYLKLQQVTLGLDNEVQSVVDSRNYSADLLGLPQCSLADIIIVYKLRQHKLFGNVI